MAMNRLYMGMENLALNAAQRNTLVAELLGLGPAEARQPAWLLHSRTRLDNEAIICEANFDTDNLSIAAFKQRVADIFSVQSGDISHATATQSFGGGNTTVITFTYNATDYIRVALFGTIDATWPESHQEVLGYLSLYQNEWEPSE